jgi:hypothetical protein
MADFRFEVSAPKLQKDAIRVRLLAANRKLAKKLQAEFEKTVKTWEGDVPEFVTDTSLTLDEGAALSVILSGPEKGVKKWFWLNHGTSYPRHAVMSDDWKSKTTPGFVGSGPGRGEVVFISRKINLPGIEARGWSKIIMKQFRPEYRAEMKEALAVGLADSLKK